MNDYYDVYDNEAMRANANYNYKLPPTMTGKVYKSHESFSEPDMVNHPDHYMVGGIEALAVIEAKLGGPANEMYRGYLMGNVMKYLMRSPYKGKREEDLRKAQFYLDGLVECFK